MHISPAQLKLLDRISKKPEVRTNASEIDDVEYLRENELVSCVQCGNPNDFFYQATISEKGKAFLYEKKHERRRSNIALSLSIAAIVLSLLTAFTPFADWVRSYLSFIFE